MSPTHHRAIAFVVTLLLAIGIAHVPSCQRAPSVTPNLPSLDAGSTRAHAGPIDLNRAGVNDLASLPGIGRALAARIVAARDGGRPFRSVHDLARVRGIGPHTIARIADAGAFVGD